MWNRLPNFLKSLGVVGGLKAFWDVHMRRRPRGELFSVSARGRAIWLRDTPSDTSIFFQIFVKQEYGTQGWTQHTTLRAAYDAIVHVGKTPVIVDAGANIGLSALWFAREFPKARIFALEPDTANVEMLRRNVAHDPNVTPLRGAIWDDRTARLGISNPQAGAGAFRVVEGEGDLPAYTVPDVLALEANGAPFIVKVDIEGGESALFRSNTGWLPQVRLLVLELHDWLYPGEGTSRNFLRCVSEHRFDVLFRGENVFCFLVEPSRAGEGQ